MLNKQKYCGLWLWVEQQKAGFTPAWLTPDNCTVKTINTHSTKEEALVSGKKAIDEWVFKSSQIAKNTAKSIKGANKMNQIIRERKESNK